jgi:hypothetical protein
VFYGLWQPYNGNELNVSLVDRSMLLGKENEKSRKMRNLRTFFCAREEQISALTRYWHPKRECQCKEVGVFRDCNGCIDSYIAISISNYVDVIKLHH